MGACGLWVSARHRWDVLNRQLIAALVQHDMPQARTLVDAGADSNTPFLSLPPPSFALWCRYLLHRANPPVNTSPTAILIACGSGLGNNDFDWNVCPDSPQLVLTMLQHGADIKAHTPDKDDWSPLHFALASDHPQTVRVLIDHGANVNARGAQGETPLMIEPHQDPDSIRLLLEHGANANAQDSMHRTPLLIAMADSKTSPDVTRLLLEHGADVHVRDDWGQTLLSIATSNGNAHPDSIRQLLVHGADIEARDRYGDTPLMVACRYAPESVVRVLIDHGANVNAQEPYHETALYLLVLCSPGPEDHKAADVIPQLLMHGANPHVIANRMTALQFARYAKRPDLIAVLQRVHATK